jgi:hypothetical protein
MKMNFGAIFNAVDAVMTVRDAARRFKAANPSDAPARMNYPQPTTAAGPTNQIEARLTGVVVAALKEAFDRDHARMELERGHLEEERRRAEQLLKVELDRQAVDRELSRLRLLAGTALVGWIVSMVMFAFRVASTSTPARVMVAAGWLLLLGALASAFTAQPKVTVVVADDRVPGSGAAGTAALWMLVAGLAVTAVSLLF